MKKILVLVLAFAMMGGVAFAQIGLTVGIDTVEFNDVTGDDVGIVLTPFVEYNTSLLDSALDLRGRVGFRLGVSNDSGYSQRGAMPGFDYLGFWAAFWANWADLYGSDAVVEDTSDDMNFDIIPELEATYKMPLSDVSKLTFGLQINIPIGILPSGRENVVGLTVIPKFRFDQSLGDGGLYAGFELPLYVINQGEADNEFGMDADVFFGYDFGFGLGIKATVHLWILPSEGADVYNGFNTLFYYTMGPLYFELDIGVPGSEVGTNGLSLDVKAQYSLGSPDLVFWVGSGFGNVGGEADLTVSPYIGVKFSF